MDIKKSMSCKNAKFFKIRFLDCPDKIKKKKKKAMNEDNGARIIKKKNEKVVD